VERTIAMLEREIAEDEQSVHMLQHQLDESITKFSLLQVGNNSGLASLLGKFILFLQTS
jgi:uncharacterized coiled-coil protein SlyX